MTTAMRRVVACALLSWVPLGIACSESEPDASVGALVVTGGTVDLGELDEWEEPEAHFRFRNASDRTLQITGLEASCTCTGMVVTLPGRKPIDMTVGGQRVAVDAGGCGSISVRTKLRRIEGERKFTLRCFTDDPQGPVAFLSWTVRVRPYCQVTPRKIVLDDVAWDRPASFSAIVSPRSRRFRVTGHAPVPNGWVLRLREVQDDAGTSFAIEGSCDPRQAKVLEAMVTLHTDGPIADIEIPVAIRLKPLFDVTPKRMFTLSATDMREGGKLTLTLRGLDDVALRCESVRFVDGTHPQETIRWVWQQPAADVLDLQGLFSSLPQDRLLRMRYAVATGHPYEREVVLTILGTPARSP